MKTKPAKKTNKAKLDAMLRLEIFGKATKHQDCDEVAAQAEALCNGFELYSDTPSARARRVREFGSDCDPLAYEDDDGKVTAGQEFRDNFSMFRSQFGGSAVIAALLGEADYFERIAAALRRRENQLPRKPNERDVAILKSLRRGATAYKAAQEWHGEKVSHDEPVFQNTRKQAERLEKKSQS